MPVEIIASRKTILPSEWQKRRMNYIDKGSEIYHGNLPDGAKDHQ